MIPLLLLPGMMCDARLFAAQVAAINNRGVMVAPITAHDSVQALAAQVLAQAPERFALAGLSMGGIVAMEVLRQSPQRVERLCLMDTNPLAEHKNMSDRREAQMKKVRTGGLVRVLRDEMKPNYLYDGTNRQELLDLCMDMALGLGEDVFIRQSLALQNRPDQRQTLEQYNRPTLILHGVDDRLCPAQRHQLIKQLMPHADYCAIAAAGHLPTLEQPQEVNRLLSAWLEG